MLFREIHELRVGDSIVMSFRGCSVSTWTIHRWSPLEICLHATDMGGEQRSISYRPKDMIEVSL